MILVSGAAGKTGRAIIRELTKKGEDVRALVYRTEQVGVAESCGADEVVIGDMREVESFKQAAQRVNKIYHICPNMNPHEIEIGRSAIFAAQAASVDQFVYHSVLHPQTQKMPHHWSKLQVEELLLESHLPFTILQPTIYMQNLLPQWDEIIESGIYAVPYSVEVNLCMVDLDEVAEAAAHVLMEPGHLRATYELAGPNSCSANKIAMMIGRKLGRSVKAEAIPLEDWAEEARASGLGSYQLETLVKMFRYYDEFGFWGNDRTLSYLLGQSATGLETFIQRTIENKNSGI